MSQQSDTPQELQIQEIRHLITEAGREPRERDTLYREVSRGARFTDWSVAE